MDDEREHKAKTKEDGWAENESGNRGNFDC